jgi:hypothetical protein
VRALDFGRWVQPAPVSLHAKGKSNPAAAAGAGAEPRDPTPLEVLQRFVGATDKEVPKVVDQLVDEVGRSGCCAVTCLWLLALTAIVPLRLGACAGGLGGVQPAPAPRGVGTHHQVSS